MKTTPKVRRAAKIDSLVAQLIEDCGFQSEPELVDAFGTADKWAGEYRLALIGVVGDGETEGFEAKIGPEQGEFVCRFTVGMMAKASELKSPRRRKLLAAATAWLAFSNPLLRRHVEAGRCEQE